MREFGISGKHAGDGTIAGQGNIQDEIVARQARDFEEFAMQRVVLDGALHGARVPHELGTVQHLDGFLSGQSGSNQFPAARVAEHEMRLDETKRDVEFGRGEAFIDVHGRTGAAGAEMPVGREIAGIVVDDAKGRGDFLPTDFADLAFRSGAVEAGGDQDGDVFAENARLLQAAEYRRKSQAVRRRPCDIANGNGGAVFAARELGQGRRADGAIERRFESSLPAWQRRGAARLQDAIAEGLRQMDGKAGLPEGEFDLHQRHRTTGILTGPT